jgi:hypothetical protein
MSKTKIFYPLIWLAMLCFLVSAFITEEMYYLIGSSLCMGLGGIGDVDEKARERSKSNKKLELVMALYLSGLAVFLLVNSEFVRTSSTLVLFLLFALPFIPMIYKVERRKFRRLK